MDIYYSLLSLSVVISCMDGKSVVDGKVLEPIYWNSSNSKLVFFISEVITNF